MSRFLITNGLVYKNTEGYDAVVVGRDGYRVLLQFQDKHKAIVNVANGNVNKGHFCNPYHISVAGFGFYGQGKFIAKVNGKHTEEYEHWNSMLKRCYKSTKHMPTYADKSVHDCWRNFQVFAEWAVQQKGFGLAGWHLDKDLLVKGNTQYSPDTCVYLPHEINAFIKRKRFNDLPLGVDIVMYANNKTMYRVQSRWAGKNIGLGIYDKVEKAFSVYKEHKEMIAKDMAERWRVQISDSAFSALYGYTVEITD